MQQPSFFARLFDTTFNEFVTPKIISLIFVLSIILAGVGALSIFLGMATAGGLAVVLGLVLGLLVFLAYVIVARVTLEAVVALFKIAENTAVMARYSVSRQAREGE